jgi:(p)ppGpp synthase/HD superfamily hydrolase
VQLFEQLRTSDLGRGDLQRIRAGCAAALDLFAGCVHPSGKPYVAHCTASASTLAALGADADLIIAGLLHGAYRSGDFGWRTALALKRRYAKRHFGGRVEDRMFRFFIQPWHLEDIEACCARIEDLDTVDRDAVLMHLASELDNLRDRALLYRANADTARVSFRARGPLLVELADRMGVPALGGAIAAAAADNLDANMAAELRSDFAHVTLIPPPSAQRRLSALLARATLRLFQRLRTAQRRRR